MHFDFVCLTNGIIDKGIKWLIAQFCANDVVRFFVVVIMSQSMRFGSGSNSGFTSQGE